VIKTILAMSRDLTGTYGEESTKIAARKKLSPAELEKKIQDEEEFMSYTGGVRPMQIQGPTSDVRYRLSSMTDIERQWRKQWLKDQILAPDEPRHVPELEREFLNPIRRFYRWPMDNLVEKPLRKYIGEYACNVRWLTAKFALIGVGMFYTFYYLKYHSRDWTRFGGWRIRISRPISLPGDENYPYLGDRKKPQDYYLQGFDKSPI